MDSAGSRLKVWLEIALRGKIVFRALKVAGVVGSILVLINHGDALLSTHVSLDRMIKIALTYCVPYCVATYASVSTVIEQIKNNEAE